MCRPHHDLAERRHLLRLDARTARKGGMERRHPPVVAAAGCLERARERRTDHHGVRPTRDRFGDVAPGAHATIRDHVAVPPGLVLMLPPRCGRVGDRRGLRHADPEDAPARARVPRSHADEDADRSGPHQVQRGRVRCAPSHDHRDVERRDELLEVERLVLAGDVLARDDGSLDHQDVELSLEDQLRVALHALWGERGTGDHAAGLDLLDATTDQLLADRLGVQLLHAPGGLVIREAGDLVVDRVGILVPGPQPLEVETRQTAQLPDLDRRCR